MLGSYTLAAIDMRDFFERQRRWSYETFGPRSHRGPAGPLRHLVKEAAEALEADSHDKQWEEIADCLFLVFDAAHRAGMTYANLTFAAMDKLNKNQSRKWPDWRTVPADQPIEHVRGEQA